MTGGLARPDKPAGYVVSVDPETGVATRNDGRLLQPAAKNPWYVLMTVAGEPKSILDHTLLSKNRRFWNRWVCHWMSETQRAQMANQMRVPIDDLAPLSEEELLVATTTIRSRASKECVVEFEAEIHAGNLGVFGGDKSIMVPYGPRVLDFSEHYFGNGFIAFGLIFPKLIVLSNSYFEKTFGLGGCFFGGALVATNNTFSDLVWFKGAEFRGLTNFSGSCFSEGAHFGGAKFSSNADFICATFASSPEFSDTHFGGATSFCDALFQSGVPEFYQSEIHQDTVFTERRENWPEITPENASESKRAYVRLRQIMNGLHKPDAEAFFGRQELRCDAEMNGAAFKALSRFYGAVSDYGYSVARPAGWLAAVVGFGWGFMGSYLNLASGGGAAQVWQGLGLSVANTFPYLGFQRLHFGAFWETSPWWVDLVAAGQTVAGGVLLFFLLLGLRNRFRLK